MRAPLVALATLPLSIVSIVLLILGRAERATSWERAVAQWADEPSAKVAERDRPRPARRALLAHVGATLPATVVAFTLAATATLLLVMNLGYPLRADVDGWDRTHLFSSSANVGDAWGGPTLAGAWLVHAVGASAIAAVLAWPTGRLVRIRVRSVVRRLVA